MADIAGGGGGGNWAAAPARGRLGSPRAWATTSRRIYRSRRAWRRAGSCRRYGAPSCSAWSRADRISGLLAWQLAVGASISKKIRRDDPIADFLTDFRRM